MCRPSSVKLLGQEAFVFTDEEEVARFLELDTNFNTTLGPLHEDYEDRVVRLTTRSNIPNVEVYVASAIDVAISKLGRFSARDEQDIHALLAQPNVDLAKFERLAREAIRYFVGNQTPVECNLNTVLVDFYSKGVGGA